MTGVAALERTWSVLTITFAAVISSEVGWLNHEKKTQTSPGVDRIFGKSYRGLPKNGELLSAAAERPAASQKQAEFARLVARRGHDRGQAHTRLTDCGRLVEMWLYPLLEVSE